MFKLSFYYQPLNQDPYYTFEYCDSFIVKKHQEHVTIEMFTRMPERPDEFYAVSVPHQIIVVKRLRNLC